MGILRSTKTGREVGQVLRKEAALVFATGYQTNLGAIPALVGRNKLLLSIGKIMQAL